MILPDDIKWIKLSTDFFEDRKIKQIRAMPDGDAMLLIWLNLLVLAGLVNDGGLVYLTHGIPYTEEMLAEEMRRSLPVVRSAISLFRTLNMVEDTPDGLLISNWEKHQSVDGMERVREQNRIRQAKKREKDKMKLIGASNKCVYCGGFADTIDHVIPVCDDGPNTPDNTVPCCMACNMSKSKYTVASFLNRRLLEQKYIDKDGIEASPVLQKIVFFNSDIGKYEMMRDVLRDTSRDITHQNKNKKENKKEEDIYNTPPRNNDTEKGFSKQEQAGAGVNDILRGGNGNGGDTARACCSGEAQSGRTGGYAGERAEAGENRLWTGTGTEKPLDWRDLSKDRLH